MLILLFEQVLTFFFILLFVPGLVDRFVGKMPLYAYSFSITSQCQFILQMKLQLESTMDVVIQVCYFSKSVLVIDVST